MSEQNEQAVAKKSWKQYFAFVKDRQFWKVLVLGQVLSLCITGTNVTTTILSNKYNFSAATLQTFLVYACVALVYNSIAIYKRGLKGWLLQFWRRGIYYFFLGFVDVEGNYFVVKSYEYTSLLSAMLLDCWSTPVCMILAFIFMKVRYRWVQYVGVFLALCGLGMLVASDVITGKNYDAVNALKGDLFCILGATFYGLSNTGEEYMARKHPLYEVIGMFTFFATFINLVQVFIFERHQWSELSEKGIGAMVAVYTICMFVLYSCAPVLFRLGSAVLYNLSILTSDFYGLIFGLGLFGYKVTPMYPFAYIIIIIGIAIYHIFPVPEPAIGNFTSETAEREKMELYGTPFTQGDIENQQRASMVTTEVIPTTEEVKQ
ncbi:solute carrier family 35 member SLC35F1/F2/F6 [Cokeromyces recurvatus]|uniref:solute carrier family 35 member SLC35F1/F2/F6 n=1 Tax=Cokeromyces recurvatus TaxID=90255 RepID=UPI00221E6DF9|nr:solute carrier family 35 member SLC35F1/F2/F6 [Cokeromyces recurvatus]KAI7898039.1 solute carrier family 35 member SLC35F1/F2/F6 [Cokeromyces recurvatus]